MKLKKIEAIGLFGIIRNLKMTEVKSVEEKLKVARLVLELKKHAEEWDAMVEVLNTTDSTDTLEKASSEIVEVNSQILTKEVLQQLVSSNPEMAAGSIAAVIEMCAAEE